MGTKRFDTDEGIPTLALALSEYMTVDELKKLVALTEEVPPTRKADLAAVISDTEADRLRRSGRVWTTHSVPPWPRWSIDSTQFPAEQFRAKYRRAA
jgi:hypothetical protein